MLRYILKRILLMIPVILGVLVIVFCVARFGGDPVWSLIGADATEEEYQIMYHQLGLDRPYIVQFFDYVLGVVTRFDLGVSYATKLPVLNEVIKRLPISLTLAIISNAISVVLGIVFGILCAINQNSKIDYILTLLSLIAASLPGFWFALMLMLFFSVWLGWLPATGIATWKAWIMPCIAMGMGPIATIARTTRSSMLEVIRQDYIRTARSKGVAEFTVIYKHAFKNAIIPVITVIGAMVNFSIGGAVVIETIFNIPGIGTYMMTGIVSNDYPVIQGTVLVLSLIVCIINLIVDILYGFVDPRIKAKYITGKKKTTKAVTVRGAKV